MKAIGLLLMSFSFVLQAQTFIAGVINDYSRVMAVDLTCNFVTALSPGYFSVGDRVLLIQMKGAKVDSTSNNANFGNITAINNAGNYEFNEITFIDVDKLYMKYTMRGYTPSGLVQVIRVPQYTDVEITGTLTALPWDGNIGGVLVFESTGAVTMNANIDVNSVGFVGGALSVRDVSETETSGCTGFSPYFSAGPLLRAGQKGESIFANSANYHSARGKNAAGGGGGNDHNCGGGGGANFGAGGIGGSKSSTCGAFSPNGQGLAGVSLSTFINTNNKIFFGSGGGGGQQNNAYELPTTPTNFHADKGNGGGIVIIRANEIISNSSSITANGTDVYPRYANGTIMPTSENLGDGSNGGGAGGTIILDVNTVTNNLIISANGGKGGYTNDDSGTLRYLGPGGGGGGGAILLKTASAMISTSVVGGAAGIARNGTTNTSGAANGSAGSVLTGITPVQNATFVPGGGCGTPTPITFLSFSATPNKSSVDLSWDILSDDERYFILERSGDGFAFQQIASVTKTGENHYAERDNMPFSGTSYYRLWYVNNDGRKIFLAVRRINMENAGHQLSLVPNPASSDVYVNGIDEATGYSVLDVAGREIFSGVVNPGEALSVMRLPAGVYLLSLRNSAVVETHRLVRE